MNCYYKTIFGVLLGIKVKPGDSFGATNSMERDLSKIDIEVDTETLPLAGYERSMRDAVRFYYGSNYLHYSYDATHHYITEYHASIYCRQEENPCGPEQEQWYIDYANGEVWDEWEDASYFEFEAWFMEAGPTDRTTDLARAAWETWYLAEKDRCTAGCSWPCPACKEAFANEIYARRWDSEPMVRWREAAGNPGGNWFGAGSHNPHFHDPHSHDPHSHDPHGHWGWHRHDPHYHVPASVFTSSGRRRRLFGRRMDEVTKEIKPME